MEIDKKIKYGTIVPLIGGQVFGARKVLNSDPEYILSYSAFIGNDKLLLDYLRSKGNEVPYYQLDKIDYKLDLPKVDFMSTLCPCSALSQLNNGKKRGANAPQNEWMYMTAEYVLEKIKPKVFMGENAPGLFGPIGEPVVEKLMRIGEKYDYSMTVVRTSTMLHGIPQQRIRSFYFFWDSKTCPKLSWYKKPMPTIADYLEPVKTSIDPVELQERIDELQNEPLYIWLKQEYGDWRAFMKLKKGSMMDVMISSGRAEDYIEWVKKNYPQHEKRAAHAIFKRSNGMGFWDGSPFLPSDWTGAFTGARMNAIHPVEDRILTRRELMHFMGLPIDMEIPKKDDMGKVFQNVPSYTAGDWTREAVKFIKGELEMSKSGFVKHDNINQRIEIKNKAASLF